MKRFIIGVDEVGIGAIAGPVVAAAVVFLRHADLTKAPIKGIRDSKKLTEARRFTLEPLIKEAALHWAVVGSNACTINLYGIQACKIACLKSCAKMCQRMYPDYSLVIVDGVDSFLGVNNLRTMKKADDKVAAVGAASILAKTHRDRIMIKMAYKFPSYDFDKNKGYPSPKHKEALVSSGICSHHRKDYGPVRDVLDQLN